MYHLLMVDSFISTLAGYVTVTSSFIFCAGENLTLNYLSHYLEALESDFKHVAIFAISGAGTRAIDSNPPALHVQMFQFLHFKSRSLELLNQENLTLNYLSPYLEALESYFKHVANFAISGAGGAGTRAIASNPPALHVQVFQFLHFKSRSLELLNQGLKDMITEGFQNAMYLFDIGQNDLYGAFASLNFSESVQSTVSEIKSAIQIIYNNGGKNFWVHNTGPFGCLPDRLSVRKDDADLDSYGCLVTMNNGAMDV